MLINVGFIYLFYATSCFGINFDFYKTNPSIMKTLKLLFGLVFIAISLNSCIIETDNYYDGVSLEEVVTNYDLWYVDYNRTTGYGDVPFLSKAFTITFSNGRVFANNNLVGIGFTGNGYGIQIGTYTTYNGVLEVHHSLDGNYEFEVIADTPQSIRLRDTYHNVTYYLEGYSSYNFDYDQVFYDNIEYFLQEYDVWAKTYTSIEGELNAFDNENYLSFTPENTRTFYSSLDEEGTLISDLLWDYQGRYEVYDVNGYDNLKILTLHYDNGDTEEFELSVLDDSSIELYHNASGTTYDFDGYGFIQYRKGAKSPVEQGKKRIKVQRKSVDRKPHLVTQKKEHTAGNLKKVPARK